MSKQTLSPNGYMSSSELEITLKQHDLTNRPERIFNIDETGFSPEHTPPKVVGPRDIPLQSICSPRSFTTTLIACASATGTVIPPYFVFKGKRDSPDLLNGCLTVDSLTQ